MVDRAGDGFRGDGAAGPFSWRVVMTDESQYMEFPDGMGGMVRHKLETRTPLIVSYATKDRYAAHLEDLKATCAKHGLDYEFELMDPFEPTREGWRKGSWIKIDTLHSVWKRTDRPLLWVDADSIFHEDPTPHLARASIEGADLAMCWCPNAKRDAKPGMPIRGSGGTIYVGTNPIVDDLLTQWRKLNWSIGREHLEDDQNSHVAVSMTPGVDYRELPPSLCFVYDSGARFPGVTPIIEHFQASRAVDRGNIERPKSVAAKKAAMAKILKGD